ncbi:hypothetical protein LX36DRAFT_649141 [Colletotrichum falcatum]|nr:hypothetical protein LX36DRAFT_649141 [Colletotrichum falcatum]
MQSMYPLLLLLWSLSCTFAAPLNPKEKGLRNDRDTYTVVHVRDDIGDVYSVYSPYYHRKTQAVTTLIFPTGSGKNDQIIIYEAFNAKEQPRKDYTPRLHLSDVVQALASSRHANRPLASINWLVAEGVTNIATVDVIKDYYSDWQKRQADPTAKLPERLTIKPSDSFWPSFKTTPFFKTANFTFKSSRKTVSSIDMVLNKKTLGKDVWFRMAQIT